MHVGVVLCCVSCYACFSFLVCCIVLCRFALVFDLVSLLVGLVLVACVFQFFFCLFCVFYARLVLKNYLELL